MTGYLQAVTAIKGGMAEAARRLPVPGKSDEARRKSVSRDVKIAGISSRAKTAAKEAGLDDNLSALLSIAQERTRRAQIAKVHELAERKRKPAGRRSPASRRHIKLERGSKWWTDQINNLARAWKEANVTLQQLVVLITIRQDPEFARLLRD